MWGRRIDSYARGGASWRLRIQFVFPGVPPCMKSRWPSELWIVRHGESAGNVARDLAHASGLGRIDIAERDVDVPLSDLGEEQARALGRWFADQPVGERPEVVLTSPYLRAIPSPGGAL